MNDNTTVYLGNVPYAATEPTVKEWLEGRLGIGSVITIRLPFDHDTGTCRGFGFATLATEWQAADLIAVGTLQWQGRRVRFDQYKPVVEDKRQPIGRRA